MSVYRWLGICMLALAVAPGVGDLEDASGCTGFCVHADSTVLFGKNFDWFTDVGLVVVNKRGVFKTALLPPEETPATWTSRYGSVTFNQVAVGLPFGGINEAGLVIEVMWLEETVYPERDERPAVSALQWIQYLLDRYATVGEAVADSLVRISPGATPLHFLACDAGGDVAALEFLAGEFVCRTGDDLVVPVLTNSTYDESVAYLHLSAGFGGEQPQVRSLGSLDRFVCAADLVARYDGSGEPVEYAFGVLDSVASEDQTQWSIVYDVSNMRVHFRTIGRPGVRTIEVSRMGFGCKTPIRVVDLGAVPARNLNARMIDLEPEFSLDLVKRSNRAYVRAGFYSGPPADEILEYMASYYRTMECKE